MVSGRAGGPEVFRRLLSGTSMQNDNAVPGDQDRSGEHLAVSGFLFQDLAGLLQADGRHASFFRPSGF